MHDDDDDDDEDEEEESQAKESNLTEPNRAKTGTRDH